MYVTYVTVDTLVLLNNNTHLWYVWKPLMMHTFFIVISYNLHIITHKSKGIKILYFGIELKQCQRYGGENDKKNKEKTEYFVFALENFTVGITSALNAFHFY